MDTQPMRCEGNIVEPETTKLIGRRLSMESGYRVMQAHQSTWHNSTARVDYSSPYGSNLNLGPSAASQAGAA